MRFSIVAKLRVFDSQNEKNKFKNDKRLNYQWRNFCAFGTSQVIPAIVENSSVFEGHFENYSEKKSGPEMMT